MAKSWGVYGLQLSQLPQFSASMISADPSGAYIHSTGTLATSKLPDIASIRMICLRKERRLLWMRHEGQSRAPVRCWISKLVGWIQTTGRRRYADNHPKLHTSVSETLWCLSTCPRPIDQMTGSDMAEHYISEYILPCHGISPPYTTVHMNSWFQKLSTFQPSMRSSQLTFLNRQTIPFRD